MRTINPKLVNTINADNCIAGDYRTNVARSRWCSVFLLRWDCCVAPVNRTGICCRPSFPSLLTTAGLAAAAHHVVSIWCHPSAQTSGVTDNAYISIITVTCWEPTCWLQSRMSRLCAASQWDRTQMLPSVDMWCGSRERNVIKDR